MRTSSLQRPSPMRFYSPGSCSSAKREAPSPGLTRLPRSGDEPRRTGHFAPPSQPQSGAGRRLVAVVPRGSQPLALPAPWPRHPSGLFHRPCGGVGAAESTQFGSVVGILGVAHGGLKVPDASVEEPSAREGQSRDYTRPGLREGRRRSVLWLATHSSALGASPARTKRAPPRGERILESWVSLVPQVLARVPNSPASKSRRAAS